MPHLKIPLDFTDQPKFKKLVQIVGVPMATCCVFRLYLLAAKESPMNGHLSCGRSEIEARISWHSRNRDILEALQEAGYLAETNEGYQMKDWSKEQGHFLKFRLKAQRAARALWKRSTVDAPSNATSNAPSMEVVASG